ncbi:MAG TPA: phasin family protein [Azospirillaceae bacterium]|nr:phasin family protein [Azospirillaceae bacterium]
MATEKEATAVKDGGMRRGEIRDAAAEIGRIGRGTAETATATAIGLVQSAPGAAEAPARAAREGASQAADAATRFAEEQARLAREFTDRASRNVEAMMQAQTIVAGGLQTLWKEWMSFTQDSMQRWAEQAQTLAQTRSIQDLVATQNDIMRSEIDVLLKSGMRLSEVATQTASDAARRITERTEAAA